MYEAKRSRKAGAVHMPVSAHIIPFPKLDMPPVTAPPTQMAHHA